MKVALVVDGKPVAKGSMRTFRKSIYMVHNNQDGIARYAADIRVAWEQHEWVVTKGGAFKPEPKGVPMVLKCTFVFQRPASHYLPANSRRDLPELRKDAPLYHSQDPDGDKLMRSIGDALTGLAYHDDNQVVIGEYMKRWGDVHRTYIEVKRYDDDGA